MINKKIFFLLLTFLKLELNASRTILVEQNPPVGFRTTFKNFFNSLFSSSLKTEKHVDEKNLEEFQNGYLRAYKSLGLGIFQSIDTYHRTYQNPLDSNQTKCVNYFSTIPISDQIKNHYQESKYSSEYSKKISNYIAFFEKEMHPICIHLGSMLRELNAVIISNKVYKHYASISNIFKNLFKSLENLKKCQFLKNIDSKVSPQNYTLFVELYNEVAFHYIIICYLHEFYNNTSISSTTPKLINHRFIEKFNPQVQMTESGTSALEQAIALCSDGETEHNIQVLSLFPDKKEKVLEKMYYEWANIAEEKKTKIPTIITGPSSTFFIKDQEYNPKIKEAILKFLQEEKECALIYDATIPELGFLQELLKEDTIKKELESGLFNILIPESGMKYSRSGIHYPNVTNGFLTVIGKKFKLNKKEEEVKCKTPFNLITPEYYNMVCKNREELHNSFVDVPGINLSYTGLIISGVEYHNPSVLEELKEEGFEINRNTFGHATTGCSMIPNPNDFAIEDIRFCCGVEPPNLMQKISAQLKNILTQNKKTNRKYSKNLSTEDSSSEGADSSRKNSLEKMVEEV